MVKFADISWLKTHSIHTPVLALARFLLALGMLLTFLSNDFSREANTGMLAGHHYTEFRYPYLHHEARESVPLKHADIFLLMPESAAKIVVISILLLVMTGFIPQITCLLHFWVCFSVHNFFQNENGGETVSLIASFLLIPICLTDTRLSQWRYKKTGPLSRNIFSNVAMMALKVQIALIYLVSTFSKMKTPGWRNGTAVYEYTSHYRRGAPDWLRHLNEIFTLPPLGLVVTWGIIIFEILLSFCMFANTRIKRIFLILALIFHFIIIFNFGLVTFFLAMTALLLLFLDDQQDSLKFVPGFITGKKQ